MGIFPELITQKEKSGGKNISAANAARILRQRMP
jgi:hypothetical protein